VINGNLTISEQAGDGDVTLKNVVVKGTTTIKGGGMNSIHLENSTLNSVVVNKADGHVRLVAAGYTQVGTVTLQSGAILEEDQLTAGGFEDIKHSPSCSKCDLERKLPERRGTGCKFHG
jgi:hypothetical protein